MRIWFRLPWALFAGALWAADPRPAAGAGPETALEWLKFGNERFAAGKPVHWHQSAARRNEVAAGVRAPVIVVSCSDARVPPEIVFDQGIGDLYSVRVEGPAAGEKELGSIEYAVDRLGSTLIVVMGHSGCGLMEAAVRGTPVPGHAASLLASLSAAVSRSRGLPGDPVDNAARTHVNLAVESIRHSEPVLAPLIAAGRVKVVPAYYRTATGTVEWEPAIKVSATPQPGAATAQRLLRSGM